MAMSGRAALRHAGRRLLIWAPTLLVVLLAVYALAFFGAGDPVKLIFLRAPGDVAYDPARIAAIRASAGLDRPFLVQFGGYLAGLARGDLGNSLVSGRPVAAIIAAAAPVSLQLGLATMVVATLAGVPLGLLAALRRGGALDHSLTALSLTLWAVPPYVLGPLIMVGAITLLPASVTLTGWGGLLDGRIVLPVAVAALQPFALIQRQSRAAVAEVLTESHVRTARAKGLTPLRIAVHHALRPALRPIVTQIGLLAITFINGAVFIEVVFGLPGLGRLTVSALTDADYPVILAVTLIGAVAVVVSNLLVDLLYPLLDPRVSLP